MLIAHVKSTHITPDTPLYTCLKNVPHYQGFVDKIDRLLGALPTHAAGVILILMREINNLNDMLPILTYYEESSDYREIGAHFHSYHELILVREGEVTFRINQKKYHVRPNSLVIIRAMDKHDVYIKKNPYMRYVFTVTNQLLLTAVHEPKLISLFLTNNPKSRNLILLRPEITERLNSIFEETILECTEKKPFWSSRVITCFFQALIELYREDPDMFDVGDNTGSLKTVMQVQHYIAEHYREKIDLDKLAEQFFMSKFYLSRRFKEITGHNFKSYLILHRISKAQQLLRHTDKPVSEICEDVGYENTEHFIRTFNKFQAITPHQYRLLYRKLNGSSR